MAEEILNGAFGRQLAAEICLLINEAAAVVVAGTSAAEVPECAKQIPTTRSLSG